MKAEYLFEAWDETTAMIREKGRTSTYLTLTDLNAYAGHEEQLHRFDFDDPTHLAAVRNELRNRREAAADADDPYEPDSDDEQDDSDDGKDEADSGKPPKDDPEAEAELERDAMIERAIGLLKREAEGVMPGERVKKFRVRAYRGSSTYGSRSFVVRSTATFEPGEDPSGVRAPVLAPQNGMEGADGEKGQPAPAYDHNIGLASVHGFRALGYQYERFGRFVLDRAEKITGIQERQMGVYERALTESRRQTDEALAALVTLRSVDANTSEAAAKQMSEAERAKIATKGFDTLSELGKAFMISKGLTPEAVKAMNAVTKNPKLALFLQREDVQVYLQDEKEVEQLVALLEGAIAQYMAQRQQQQQKQTSGSTAGQQP